MVEFDVHNLPKIKMIVHITQSVFIFVSAVMEIAVFTKADTIDGRAGWYFGLVSLLFLFPSFLTFSTIESKR